MTLGQTVFSPLKKAPVLTCANCPLNLAHSESQFGGISLPWAGQTLLEMPEAKEFAVGFSLADAEGGARGYWEQYPVTSCLGGGSLSLLLTALPRAPSQLLSPFRAALVAVPACVPGEPSAGIHTSLPSEAS